MKSKIYCVLSFDVEKSLFDSVEVSTKKTTAEAIFRKFENNVYFSGEDPCEWSENFGKGCENEFMHASLYEFNKEYKDCVYVYADFSNESISNVSLFHERSGAEKMLKKWIEKNGGKDLVENDYNSIENYRCGDSFAAIAKIAL